MSVKSKKVIDKIKEEFLMTTETLWENEIQSNLFFARVLTITAIMDLIVIVLVYYFNVFTINSASTILALIRSFFELLLIAILCFILKGKKKWLKIVMVTLYTIVLSRIAMILGHNVVLLIAFPIIISVRYYSKYVTFYTGIITIIFTTVAYYVGIINGSMRLDLNMVEVPAGTTISFDIFSTLRSGVESQVSIDRTQLWLHSIQHSLLPKILLYLLIIHICVKIAKKGRKMIFDQQRETMKTERLATELNLASEIQSSMLPSIFPAFPERDEFDIYASMNPAKEVGGDFYDFYLIDDDHLALVIADVSGKGIPAAMFMMASKIIINNYSLIGNIDPGEILIEANKRISSNNPSEMFVTVWLGILEISTGKLKAANAGHEYPFIYHKEKGQFEKLQDHHGLVLGAMEISKYKTYEFTLEPGDALFVYTDGVPEATNIDNEQFSEERLSKALNKNPEASCKDLIDNMTNDISEFVKDAPQFDDITMLAMRYKGKK